MSALCEPATCSPRAPTLLSSATIAEELVGALPSLKVTSREDYPYQIRTNSCGILRVCPCDGAIRTRFVENMSPDGVTFDRKACQWNFESLVYRADIARAIYLIEGVVGGAMLCDLDPRRQGFVDPEEREREARDQELRRADRGMLNRFYRAINEGIPYHEMDVDVQRWWWDRY